MINFKKIFFFLFLSGLFFIAGFRLASAAELTLSAANSKLEAGEQFQVDLLLNTQGESINALEGNLKFPTNLLRLKKITDGNSVISLWIEKPQANADGLISFSGITPGGINIDKAFIFSLTFEAIGNGQADLEISQTRALLNDGTGSAAILKITPISLAISQAKSNKAPVSVEIADNLAPESFNAEVAQDKLIFDNHYFIVFATQDKGSGIAGYEVRESRSKFFAFLKSWRAAKSPYLLRDQEMKSYIFVKAMDLNGNEKIEVIPPQKLSGREKSYLVYAIIILGLVAYILWKISKRKKKSRR